VLAAGKVKRLLQPLVGDRWYRIFFNAMSLLSFALVIILYQKTAADSVWERGWLSIVAGLLLLVPGLSVGYYASMQYSMREFSGLSYLRGDPQAGNQLNTEGINALVRHPLYLSLLLLMAAWLCFQPQWRVLAVFGITLLYVPVGIYFEEKKLIDSFGAAYTRYQDRVSMLIPWIW
jgi:protein-S-isoprenylcysteine O-methyltransferase Ste14